MTEVLLLLLGLSVLTVGADLLVRGASAVALRLGLSSLIVGLTVVAFGTSAPELAVSLKAGLSGQGDIAVGNIVGSNIFNVAAILGISAMLRPLAVNISLVRRDMPIMLGASVLFVFVLMTGQGIARWEGVILFALLIAYVVLSIRTSRTKPVTITPVMPDGLPPAKSNSSLLLRISLVIVGLAMLLFGAQMFVNSAVGIARSLGWSEAVIGLTIVAAGTSMPELATSVIASLKRQTDIAVGNVVGSNLFNLLGIGGITAGFTPLSSSGFKILDFAAMLIISILLLPLIRSGFQLARWEGAALFGMFIGYLWLVWP